MSPAETCATAGPEKSGDYFKLYLQAQRRYERERLVRLEAEAIAEKGLRELHERERQQTLLEAVARQANGTSSEDEALRFTLVEVCRHTGWACGFVYLPRESDTSRLALSPTWYTNGDGVESFVQATISVEFPLEIGLPGRVRASMQACWIPDVVEDTNFLRSAAAAACGLRTAVAFPIVVAGAVVAVVEFLSREALEPDPTFLAVLAQIGTQLGRVYERAQADRQLVHDATHDALTRLPNRVLFVERLQRTITRTSRVAGSAYAVLFVDLDRFKLVNDSLGHQSGDQLLTEIAGRFARVVVAAGAMHTLARLGGDEFAVLLEEIASDAEALAIGERLLRALDEPILIDNQALHASASVGITFGVIGYTSAAEVMRDADLAMYRAKSLGRSRVATFDPSLHLKAILRLAIESDLRRAVRQQQFVLHYQPIIALGVNRLTGLEALVRWQKKPGVLVPPNEFIGLAEETGLIVDIGTWVLREACRTSARWNKGRSADDLLAMSVNVSSRQFQQPDFVNQVQDALAASGADPRTLRIEITESVAIKNTDRVVSILDALHALGVRISIDDFGTGYSSLSLLHRLPFDTIKIDRSFIRSMSQDQDGREIVRTILDLARNLRMDVVAEGTETSADVDSLRGMGCGYAQGYYFSRPVDEQTVDAWLSTGAIAGISAP